jgi:sugar (pentulose or hexulose) kinase
VAITIGIDLGTTTLTALAVEVPSGCVKTWATAPSRGDANELIRAALWVIGECAENLGRSVREVAGLGITGQQHGVVLVDRRLGTISRFYNWRDETAKGEGEQEARDRVGDAYLRTGCRIRAGFGTATLFVLKRQKLLPNEATVCTLMDLLGARLVGDRPVTDPTCAASLGALDVRAADWDCPTLEALDLPRAWFPDVVPVGTSLGGLLSEHAGTTGLPAGLPVFVGVGDNQASYLGGVRDPADTVLVNVGTGGQVTLHADRFHADDRVEARPYFDGKFLLVSAGEVGGAAFASYGDFFRPIDKKRDWLDWLVEQAQGVWPGCQGLRCEPFFHGTRRDPERRGAFTGVTARNFTPGHFARAILEGMARTFDESRRHLEAVAGRAPATLVGTGNGVKANPLLVEVIATAFRRPLFTPEHREEAAFGACLVAGVGLGVYPSFADTARVIRYLEPVAPVDLDDAHHP